MYRGGSSLEPTFFSRFECKYLVDPLVVPEMRAYIRPFTRPDDFAALREHYRYVYAVGLSWGGKLSLGHALQYPDDFDGLVLITPGIRALVDVDAGTKLNILFASGLNPEAQFKMGEMLLEGRGT